MDVPWHSFVDCQPVQELTAWFWPAMQATTPVRGLQHVVPTFPVVQLFQAPAGTAPANHYLQFVPLYQPGSQSQFLGPQPPFVPPQPQWPVQPRPAIPPRGSSTGWRSVVPRPNSLPRHPGCPEGAANPQAGGIPGPSHGGRPSPAGSVQAGGGAGMHSSRGSAAVPPGHHPRNGPSTRGVFETRQRHLNLNLNFFTQAPDNEERRGTREGNRYTTSFVYLLLVPYMELFMASPAKYKTAAEFAKSAFNFVTPVILIPTSAFAAHRSVNLGYDRCVCSSKHY